jgi:signal transduction histidine kinase
MDEPLATAQRYSVPPRAAAISIVSFWAVYYASVTARTALVQDPNFWNMLDNRLSVAVAGMGLTWLLYLFLRRLDHKRLTTRIAAAFLASLPVSAAYAATNFWSFYVYDPNPEQMEEKEEAHRPEKWAGVIIAENALNWYFFILSWSALYLALSYASAVRQSERETARLRAAAQSAELRALRYQVNPHFLFNTLNSLSSLVLSNRAGEAEKMILNLSKFFRTSLSADPAEDQPLADELALQRLYLDIESVRFPDRLRCEFHIDPAAATACVPGMILQPLIENAIKYGVAPARREVTVAVRATVEGKMLRLSVEDDGDTTAGSAEGTGVGLRNVSDRLAVRHGGAASLEAGPRPSGGFIATILLPLARHGC